jgi:hypothetical protein
MSRSEQTYKDRFGNEWSLEVESRRGKPTRASFTCNGMRLIAPEGETAADQMDLTATQLKDLFCAAERLLMHGKEKWYVGFRSRTGRGGRPVGGVQTRFRSERGEVRYARGMVNFRHMPSTELCQQLDVAKPAARSAT